MGRQARGSAVRARLARSTPLERKRGAQENRQPRKRLAAAGSDHAAANLVFLDGLEQGLEIALAEALVALALDDLEEDRADHRVGEDLQQDAVVARGAVDQQVQFAQLLESGSPCPATRVSTFS